MSLLQTLKRDVASPFVQQRRLVRDFIRILPADEYRVQIVSRVGGDEQHLKKTASELVDLVDSKFLSHANLAGACIFARPRNRQYILLDDLSPRESDRLVDLGFDPVLVIRSSPHKTNCILRIRELDPNPAPAREAADAAEMHKRVQKLIVEELRGAGLNVDIGAARDMQVWRFPGFSNQKRLKENVAELKYGPGCYTEILKASPGAVPRRGAEFVARAREEIDHELRAAHPLMSVSFADALAPSMHDVAIDAHAPARRERSVVDMQFVPALDAAIKHLVMRSPGKYIDTAINEVRFAQEGERNNQLYVTASYLFRFAAGCAFDPVYRRNIGFDPVELTNRLSAAAALAGLEKEEIVATIASARKSAVKKPIFPDVQSVQLSLPAFEEIGAAQADAPVEIEAAEDDAEAREARLCPRCAGPTRLSTDDRRWCAGCGPRTGVR